jgi:FMN phosphatase YigB (HAD superfamily)
MIRAVLFDVDGTLYRQPPLRVLMAGELALAPWLQHAPWNVPRLWTTLSAFRQVREDLRALGQAHEPLSRLQYTRAATRAAVPVDEMEAAVEEWIYRRPLKYLPKVVRAGTSDVLTSLVNRGVKVGVFSDYPTRDKLEAMGLRTQVSLELEATAEAINAFKPHPRGLELACERWGLAPREVLYVGDRPDVDALGAARAGMPCAIIGATANGTTPEFGAYAALTDMRQVLTHIETLGGTR